MEGLNKLSDTLDLRMKLSDLSKELSWHAAMIPLTSSDLSTIDRLLDESNYEIHALIERILNADRA